MVNPIIADQYPWSLGVVLYIVAIWLAARQAVVGVFLQPPIPRTMMIDVVTKGLLPASPHVRPFQQESWVKPILVEA